MIYFDNAATTPALKCALDAFVKTNVETFGNSESNHAVGRAASKALEGAREDILEMLGLSSTHSLVFTSGATESNNLALKGAAIKYAKRGKKIITTVAEHPSVLRPLEELKDLFGFDVSYLPITKEGIIDPNELKPKMDNEVVLVSVMAVNNEIGSYNKIEEIAKIVRLFPKAIFHVDATQAIGKMNLPYKDIDLLSFSAHKFGGVKGTGALIYKKSLNFIPVNAGGEQEKGFRAGTVNVPGMVAMDVALKYSLSKMKESEAKEKEIYSFIYSHLITEKEQIIMNSLPLGESQTPFVMNFSLIKKKASVVVEALSNKGIYVSSVSACSSKEERSSYVIEALTGDEERAENSIRLSFSPSSSMEEAKEFLSAFDTILSEVNDR